MIRSTTILLLVVAYGWAVPVPEAKETAKVPAEVAVVPVAVAASPAAAAAAVVAASPSEVVGSAVADVATPVVVASPVPEVASPVAVASPSAVVASSEVVASPAVATAAADVAPVVEKQPVQPKNSQEEQRQDSISSAAIKIPVDNANKLLYDLDAQVNQMFDDTKVVAAKGEKSGEVAEDGAHAYIATNRELADFFPRQSDSTATPNSLVTQLENLEKRLLNTINELQNRRRYFSVTMLRQMYNSVHRIRTNISRIQNQFSAPQPQSPVPSPSRPGQAGMMNQLQQRVSDIQKAVNDVINRVTSTFQGPNAQKPANQKPTVSLQ